MIVQNLRKRMLMQDYSSSSTYYLKIMMHSKQQLSIVKYFCFIFLTEMLLENWNEFHCLQQPHAFMMQNNMTPIIMMDANTMIKINHQVRLHLQTLEIEPHLHSVIALHWSWDFKAKIPAPIPQVSPIPNVPPIWSLALLRSVL